MNDNSTAPPNAMQSPFMAFGHMASEQVTPKNPQPAGLLLLWWPAFLSIGIGAFFLQHQPPEWWVGLTALGLVISCGSATWRWHHNMVWLWIVHALFAMALGFAVMQIRHASIETDLLNYPEFNVPVTGVITDAEYGRNGWRVELDDATVEVPEKYRTDIVKHYRLRLTLRGKNFTPVMGSRIATRASLIAPSPPLLPGMFDFRRNSFYEELSGYGYSNAAVTVLDSPMQTAYPLEDYRQYIGRRVQDVLSKTDFEPRNSVIGMTTAFLNGQRAGIDKRSQQDMQHSGLQHLISISGVHVSMLAAIVFFFVRFFLALSMRLALTWPIKKIAAAVALVAIILYMAVIGLSAPTVRSVLTTGVVLIAVMLDREAITLRLVAIAALIILLIKPESLITPGFQMSFAAVVGLVVFYQKTTPFWQHEFWRRNILYRLLFILCGSVATSLVATLATAPFVLYHFQQLPVLSVIANLLVTPVMAFVVMPGTLLAYLTIPFDTLGAWSVIYMGWGIAWILKIAQWTGEQDHALWRLTGFATWQIVLISLGSLWLMLQSGRIVWLGLLLIVIALSGLLFVQPPVLALIPTSSRAVIYMPPDETVIYSEGRLDKFTQQLLMQFLKKSAVINWPRDKAPPADIYIARDIPELASICDRPEKTIVSRWYVDQTCLGKTIIDRHVLKEVGEGIVVLP